MTSRERRENGMLFIADENDWIEMKKTRKLIRKRYYFKRQEIDSETLKLIYGTE